MFIFDWTYFLFIGPAILLALWAQFMVKSSFRRWSQVPSSSGLTGAQAAALMLQHAGVSGVEIGPVQGYLTDHYNPANKSLALSEPVYSGRSVSAIGVACHEAGHAIQDAEGYAFLRFRSRVVPLASFGSWISWPLIIAGILLSSKPLALVGIAAFGLLVLFQVLTLPVEFDASRRAKAHLRQMGIYGSEQEDRGVARVLGAAAMTYVAATIQSVAQLLYYLWLFGFFGRSSDS